MPDTPDDGPSPRPEAHAGERARRIVEEKREREARERRAIVDRLDELERKVAALGGGALDVPLALEGLSERIAALEPPLRVSKLREPFDWADLTDPAERALAMDELATWASDVLEGRYGARLGRRRRLPEAWTEDPLLLDVVTAAWLAWLYAYRNPGARLTEQWAWHRDVLANLEPALTAAAAEGALPR